MDKTSMAGTSITLTSTKHAMTGSSDIWLKLDVPICSAVSRIDTPLKNINKQKIKKRSRELAEYVHIDIDKKKLYIGVQYTESDMYLIKHKIDENNELEYSFLKRWIATKMLSFEYSLYDKKNKHIFTLNGLWDGNENKWISLTSEKHRSIVTTALKG